MTREYSYEIFPFYLDMNGELPPSGIIRLCVDATRRMGIDDGIPADTVLSLTGGVWMIARLSLRQLCPIAGGGSVIFRVEPLTTDKFSFIRNITLFRLAEKKSDEPSPENILAEVKICYIIVSPTERKILRPETTDILWTIAPKPIPGEGLNRLRARGGATRPDAPEETTRPDAPEETTRPDAPAESKFLSGTIVRRSDCDVNGHLNSAKYADIICDAAGYWDKPNIAAAPNVMSALQIDYSSEFLPGEKIILCASAADGGIIRGDHEDGRVGFIAEYKINCQLTIDN